MFLLYNRSPYFTANGIHSIKFICLAWCFFYFFICSFHLQITGRFLSLSLSISISPEKEAECVLLNVNTQIGFLVSYTDCLVCMVGRLKILKNPIHSNITIFQLFTDDWLFPVCTSIALLSQIMKLCQKMQIDIHCLLLDWSSLNIDWVPIESLSQFKPELVGKLFLVPQLFNNTP